MASRCLTGLDIIRNNLPRKLRGRRVGVLCHAASIASDYTHCLDIINKIESLRLTAIFGPQHGLFGQTQDNMIEWEGGEHPSLHVPVYSLYGTTRKPTPQMLSDIDALIVDLQDVGARPYTYIWTLKLCIEACAEAGIAIWILDRPNPISAIQFDGPVLKKEYFSFVGGAEIPLCHRLTIGELAILLRSRYFTRAEVNVVWMQNWYRNTLWCEIGLPWVLPSPNMPSYETSILYPGMVLLEATNLSEGRGTTRPFEIVGAPFIKSDRLRQVVRLAGINSCVIREHDFIPTFNKWQGKYCHGVQVHVINPRMFQPVFTAAILLSAAAECDSSFAFLPPPYEYETSKMPIDILSGDSELRICIQQRNPLVDLWERWREEHRRFLSEFKEIAYYPEHLP